MKKIKQSLKNSSDIIVLRDLTGPGLLLCKEFTEMHKAKIWAKSEPENGSKFYFTLPASQ